MYKLLLLNNSCNPISQCNISARYTLFRVVKITKIQIGWVLLIHNYFQYWKRTFVSNT